jgi:hypothetical protein
MHPTLGKFVEVAWLYTTIAGLLNVLVIFDAYEGPAMDEEPDPAADPKAITPGTAPV